MFVGYEEGWHLGRWQAEAAKPTIPAVSKCLAEGEEGVCGEEARAGVKGKEGGRSTIIIPCQWLDHNFLAGKHIIPGLFEPPLYSH